LVVQNRREHPSRIFLNIEHTTLDYVDLHVIGAAGRHEVSHTGDRLAIHDRAYPGGSLVLPIDLAAGEAVQLYLRVHATAASLIVPLEFLAENELRESFKIRYLLHGAILGLFASLFIYNLLIYVVLRDRASLYYVIYLPLSFMALSTLNGSGAEFLYPNVAWLANEGLVVFAGLSFSLMLLFTRAFLHTRENKRLDTALRSLQVATLLLAISPLLLPIRVTYEFGVAVIFLFPGLCSVLGISAWRRGRTEARFYVLGQMASWTGLLLFGLMTVGVLPFRFVLFEAVPLGLSADTLLLALALADRIRLLQRDKLLAENSLRKTLEIRKEELERIVTARTAELEAAHREAERQAITDPLTGIYNRRGFLAAAEREVKLALRNGRPLSAVMFDLDHFKRINDKYGHAEGDRVLCDVTSVVRNGIRSMDLFGRMGGEEFLLLLPETQSSCAMQMAERLRQRIAEDIGVGTPPEPVTVSLGVAFLEQTWVTSLDSLQSLADKALYRAKNGGRNRVELYAISV
jgi:diguanylate cyclase (GGDEF)-like protein